jgi:hypothetical protein
MSGDFKRQPQPADQVRDALADERHDDVPANETRFSYAGPFPPMIAKAHPAGGDRPSASDRAYDVEVARSVAEDAARTPTAALPHADEIQPLVPDVDLSTIRAHVGADAGAATRQLGAKAFTAGDHVVLPADASKRTVAHEVAHVAQQRRGTAPAGMGAAGDAREREADAVAQKIDARQPVHLEAPSQARQMSVQLEEDGDVHAGVDPDAYRPEAVQRRKFDREFRKGWEEVREDTAAPKKGDPFGGGHGERATISGKRVGEGGFGARLLWSSAGAAQSHAGEWGKIATPVEPAREVLDRGYQQQLGFIEQHQNESGDPEWVKAEKAYSNAWATENLETISRYKLDQGGWAQAHNDWVPVANQAHAAQAELVESAKLMGYDTSKDKDSAAFIMGIESALDMANQLVDAKVLARGQSWSTHQDDARTKSEARPALRGEPVTPHLDSATHAYNDLQSAHLGVSRALLTDRKIALEAAEGKVTAEIREINEVIEFWGGLAEFSMSAPKHVKKAEKLAKKIEKHQGQDGHRHANKELKKAEDKAREAERDPSDYEADIDSHAHLDNYEQHYDTWGKGGKEDEKAGRSTRDPGDVEVRGTEPEEIPEVPEAAPELSLGGFIKMGLTALNRRKLDELQRRLAVIGAQKSETTHTIHMAETRQAMQIFSNALSKFEDEAKKLDDASMRRRERQFVDFGHELDAYAVEHRDGLQKQHAGHLVPGQGREIYATAMACMAKIEKYRSTSSLALGMFKFNDFVSAIRVEAQERSGHAEPPESAGRRGGKSIPAPPSPPPMSKGEEDVYMHIGNEYLSVLQIDQHWSVRLEGIAARFRALMKKIDGSAGDPRESGSAF